MAYETRRPEGRPGIDYPVAWPPRAHPGIERQFEREAVALPIFAALLTSPHRAESAPGEDAVDSFDLADVWIKERDRQRGAGRPPEPGFVTGNGRDVPVENARAHGLDASGSIELASKADPSRAVTVTAELLGRFRALQAAARRVVDSQRANGFGRGTAIERLSDALDVIPSWSGDESQG